MQKLALGMLCLHYIKVLFKALVGYQHIVHIAGGRPLHRQLQVSHGVHP